MTKKSHPRLRIALAAILAVVLICAAAFAVYVNIYYHAEPAAIQAMAPDGAVSVYELRDGGCHAGFGRYGAQDGDGTPAISGDEQIDRTAQEIARTILTPKTVQ